MLSEYIELNHLHVFISWCAQVILFVENSLFSIKTNIKKNVIHREESESIFTGSRTIWTSMLFMLVMDILTSDVKPSPEIIQLFVS